MDAKMTRYVIAAVVFALIVAAGVVGVRMLTPKPEPRDYSRTRLSEKGLYSVTITPDDEPVTVGSLENWVVTVNTKDGAPVEDATIAIDGGMPEHGHGLPTSPEITASLGGGRYHLDGLRFNMGGWWVLKFAITAPPGEDTVEFNLQL